MGGRKMLKLQNGVSSLSQMGSNFDMWDWRLSGPRLVTGTKFVQVSDLLGSV